MQKHGRAEKNDQCRVLMGQIATEKIAPSTNAFQAAEGLLAAPSISARADDVAHSILFLPQPPRQRHGLGTSSIRYASLHP